MVLLTTLEASSPQESVAHLTTLEASSPQDLCFETTLEVSSP
ncbi:MAG: hypothetical protein ACI4UF_05945 [Thermoguttaceae bacterium]